MWPLLFILESDGQSVYKMKATVCTIYTMLDHLIAVRNTEQKAMAIRCPTETEMDPKRHWTRTAQKVQIVNCIRSKNRMNLDYVQCSRGNSVRSSKNNFQWDERFQWALSTIYDGQMYQTN